MASGTPRPVVDEKGTTRLAEVVVRERPPASSAEARPNWNTARERFAAALNRSGAITQWAGATPNLLNVAVTRAKERLDVVGNRELWRTAGNFRLLDQRWDAIADSPQWAGRSGLS